MIPPTIILDYLSAASASAMPLAIAWHVALALLLIALVLGWRPHARTFGILMASALLSVAGVAWVFTNPFNAVVFLLLGVSVGGTAARSAARVHVAGLPWVGLAAVMLGFAWAYPHFLPDGGWLQYTYAAPLGTIPCPTMAALVGLLLPERNLPRTMLLIVAGASLFYGTFGAVYLGVTVDWVLTAGGVVLLAKAVLQRLPMIPTMRLHSDRARA